MCTVETLHGSFTLYYMTCHLKGKVSQLCNSMVCIVFGQFKAIQNQLALRYIMCHSFHLRHIAPVARDINWCIVLVFTLFQKGTLIQLISGFSGGSAQYN